MTKMQELVPIAVSDFDGQTIRTANLRDLHAALGVGRDFSTWAKERIDKYGFVKGQDFVTQPIDFIVPQNGGTIKSKTYDGAKIAVEYHATLDMAKELAMVENNEKGRAVRRYFIEAEKQLKAMPSQPQLDVTDHLAAIGRQFAELMDENRFLRERAERAERLGRRSLPAPATPEFNTGAEGVAALRHLLSCLIEPYRREERMTIGTWVRRAVGADEDWKGSAEEAKKLLGAYGLAIFAPRWPNDHVYLGIANKHPGLTRLYAKTRWAATIPGIRAGWVLPLREVATDRGGVKSSQARYFAGETSRAVLLPLPFVLAIESKKLLAIQHH